jgi:hypothetical protein
LLVIAINLPALNTYFFTIKPLLKFMRKILLPCLAILLFASCQKNKDQQLTTKPAEASSETSARKYQYQEAVDPAILKLLREDLIRDGYIKKANDLAAEYDFETGTKKVTVNADDQSRDFPTRSVTGVGTVLANVNVLTSGGTTTSYTAYSQYGASIVFNSMNTGSAIDAYINTSAPAGTYLPGVAASGLGAQTGSCFVGYSLPNVYGAIADIDGNVFNTIVFPLRYSIYTNGSGWSSQVSSPNIVGLTSSCGSTSCYVNDTKIELGNHDELSLNDYDSCLCLPTKVKAYLYYRANTSSIFATPSWRNWAAENQSVQPGGSSNYIKGLQVRIYFIKID